MLIVDDQPLMRWSITETLAGAGHVVTGAADGAAALRAVTETSQPFDVVFLEYPLSDSHDLRLLASIRRAALGSAVVLMTAFGTPEIVKAAYQLGVCEVLNKPFDMHVIGDVVRAACGTM